MKKSAYQRHEDDVKLLIHEAKVRNNLTDEGLAKRIGMPLSTLRNRTVHPGRYRLAGRSLGGGGSDVVSGV